jgi:hypothetical protein
MYNLSFAIENNCKQHFLVAKLNVATKKDPYQLSFMDKVANKIVGP